MNDLAQIDKFLDEVVLDFKKFCPEFLKIQDIETGDIIPFILNNIQEKIIDTFLREIAEGKPVRVIILKARKMGVSTVVEAFIYWLCYKRANRKAVIVGHELTASNILLDMINRFQDEMEEAIKPETAYSNERKIVFSVMNSEIRVKTAEGRGKLGRADTPRYVHETEVGWWSDAKETQLAMLQGVPDVKDTMIVKESTANGIGGQFYDDWQDAKSGESEYIPLFFGWWEFHLYTRPFDNEEMKVAFKLNSDVDLYGDEIAEQKRYNLTLEQLHWRRHKIINKCNKDLDQFKQEYPANEIEAFIASGRPVFDMKICERMYEDTKTIDYKRGFLEFVRDKVNVITGVKFVKNDRGFIKIYEEPKDIVPEEHYRFASGWDVAEGLAQGDYSDGRYLDRKTRRVFLTWHGHIDPDRLAEEQFKISIFLKFQDEIFADGDFVDWICTERNNHGLTTITSANRLKLNQYVESTYAKGVDWRYFQADTTCKYGFLTSSKSKPYVVDRLNKSIRDSDHLDPDFEFWGECRTFVRNERGAMSAQNKDKDVSIKCFDDRVLSACLMLECDNAMSEYYVYKPEPIKEVTDRSEVVALANEGESSWASY